jgi:hypothetical protein
MPNNAYLKSAPYGAGTASPRQFLDGSVASSFFVNLCVLLTAEAKDQRGVQTFLSGYGITPGKPYNLDTGLADSRYVISKIFYTHEKAQDSTAGSNQWTAVVYVEPDPTQLMPKVDFQSTHYQETVTKDEVTAKPIVNKAGQPFATAIEESKGRLRMEICRSFLPAKLDAAQLLQMLYHKNASSVVFSYLGASYTFDKNQLYCTDIRMPLVWEPLPHYEATFVFEADNPFSDENGVSYWARHPLNQGYQHKDRANPSAPPINFREGKGVIHGGQGLLDKDGYDLPLGQTGIFLTVETIPQIDFNVFKIFPGQ